MSDRWGYTGGEISTRTGMTRSTVRKRLRAARARRRNHGRAVQFHPSDVERLFMFDDQEPEDHTIVCEDETIGDDGQLINTLDIV